MIKFYSAKTKILFTALIAVLAMPLFAQQLAFPGAEGAGMYTSGGRGTTTTPTTVFEVTSLLDDGSAGTLRYALNTSATYRTIVFRVSGTIHLNSKLNIRANTTIAGQTAPGDGICIADYPTVISGDNVIVRYMRFRMGDKNQNKGMVDGSGGDDAFGGLGVSNIIIDHCSVSWSDDEALTIYRGDNLTIQWCFITEPLNYSYHFETGDVDYEQHGYGGIWGGKRGSFHHNLLADCRNRNPRFAGISTYTPNTIGVENCDFRNNVIYNWGINTVYGGEGGNYNVVNNYYKYGPNTGSGVRYRIANPSFSATVPYGKWYVNGNFVDGSSANTTNNWLGVVPQNGMNDTTTVKAVNAFDLGYPLTMEPALQAYESVLQKSGCSLPNRDTLDQRIVNDVRNRTGRIIDVQGGYPHGTPYAQTVNAWPALNSTAAPADTDHDGMPDSYETANSLNPNDASDRNSVAANGYTNLENYLNSLAVPTANTNPTIYANASFNNFSQTIGGPSAAQTFTVSGINLSAPLIITAPANFEVSSDGITWANFLSLNPTGGSVSSTTISVRLNASAIGSYSGTISSASTGASAVNVSVNGTTGQNLQNSAIGSFPEMDGGFELQTPGSYSTVTSHSSTTKWEASAAWSIMASGARSGDKYFHFNQSSGSSKYIFSPVLTNNPLQQNSPYMIQFWYREPNTPSRLAPDSATTLSGWSTVTGATGGTGTTTTGTTATIDASTQAGVWKLFTGTLNSPNSSVTSTYAGLKVVKPAIPYFDIDDYVVYAGTTSDDTSPDPVTNVVANGSANAITVSWSAPSTGVDGGGYTVVRSTVSSAPTPNAKGVYATGNNIGTDYTVVYIGTSTSFVDNNVSSGTTYYYYIFTVDKAFNYATVVSATGTLGASTPALSTSGSLNNFTQTIGSPSLSQSFIVNGNSLTGNATVTAPANFEISEDDNSWSTSLTLSPIDGGIQSTVFVRLNANAVGNYSGTITVASTGAISVNVPASGVTKTAIVVPAGTNAVVSKDGSGDFSTIQAAINAAPTGRTSPYKIYIRKGKYEEAVNIPSSKPFIQLVGENLAETIISYDNYSGKPNPAGGTYGTSTCGTLIINAPDVMLMNLSVENSVAYGKDANATPPAPGDGPQAVAVYTTSDRVVFFNCRFNGGQDTYYGGNNPATRAYLKNCYIDGNTDFMFGSSTIIFDTCVIYPRTRLDGGNGGYVTAVNTKQVSGYGYVFRDCKITKNRGTTFYSLGRPWQNDASTADASKSWNKVAFLNTQMGSSINATGWSTWDAGTNTNYITYAEYNSKKYDGTPVDVSNRVSWSKQLTAAEAAKYYSNDTVFMNANTPQMAAWNPYTTWAELSTPFTPEISVSNLIAKKGSTTSTITWNLSWPMPGVMCDLYRSNDKSNFTLVDSQVSLEDSAGNFSFTENVPQAGQTYYYIVRASKAGFASITSDTTLVSSTPTITTTGAFVNFLQGVGTPSVTQSYSVSGTNMLDNITITPPAGYEVSSDGGTTWHNSSSPLVLTQSGGTVVNTTITVRLNGTTTGTYNGNIVHISNLATTVNMPVVGTIQSDPVLIPVVLQQWPLSQDGQDDATVRSSGVVASLPTFNNLYLSNGTTSPTYPAYSSSNGQAFGATSNGDGSWVPSPGGTPNRAYYEQFTVTAAPGYNVRVDSLLLSTAFLSTANGRLAVSWSLSNFASDSSTTIPAATPSSPLVINNQNIGFTNVGLALSATGVQLSPGQTLTVRLYYAAGSSSPARYALLNNVRFKGIASTVPVTATIITNGTLNSFTQLIGTPSTTQTYSLRGTGLTGAITITPPAGYEVSSNGGTTWFNSSTPLVLSPTGDSVIAMVSVRLNANSTGAYSGNIVHTSAGANSVNVAVSGNTVPVPVVTVTGTLNAFSQTVGAPSAVQSYTISGSNLAGNITITPPANYQVSSNGGTTWSSSAITLTPTSGTVATTTISVRLNASAAGTYSGNITNATTGATTVNVAVTGTTIPAPSITVTGSLQAFSQTLGNPSAAKTYTVSGANLTGNVVITAPANYELSTDGTNWSSSAITLNQTAGTVAAATISVRLNATAAGTYVGNITHVSTGATTVNLAVTGTAVLPPALTITQSLKQFLQVIGTPSTAQTYTISGANLTGNVTITPPLRYELSINGSAWQTTAITIVPLSGTIPTITISVRLNGIVTGPYNGNVVHATPGFTTANVPVNGIVTIKPQYGVYPVPASRVVYVVHPRPVKGTTITIYSATGQRLKVINAQPNTFETPIDLTGMRNGLYFVEVNADNQKTMLRFMKQ